LTAPDYHDEKDFYFVDFFGTFFLPLVIQAVTEPGKRTATGSHLQRLLGMNTLTITVFNPLPAAGAAAPFFTGTLP